MIIKNRENTIKNIDRKIIILKDIANLKFFIKKNIRTHPNKNKIIGILLPANNIATKWSVITKINSRLLKCFFLKTSKIKNIEKNENFCKYEPAIISSPKGPGFLSPKLLNPNKSNPTMY